MQSTKLLSSPFAVQSRESLRVAESRLLQTQGTLPESSTNIARQHILSRFFSRTLNRGCIIDRYLVYFSVIGLSFLSTA